MTKQDDSNPAGGNKVPAEGQLYDAKIAAIRALAEARVAKLELERRDPPTRSGNLAHNLRIEQEQRIVRLEAESEIASLLIARDATRSPGQTTRTSGDRSAAREARDVDMPAPAPRPEQEPRLRYHDLVDKGRSMLRSGKFSRDVKSHLVTLMQGKTPGLVRDTALKRVNRHVWPRVKEEPGQ